MKNDLRKNNFYIRLTLKRKAEEREGDSKKFFLKKISLNYGSEFRLEDLSNNRKTQHKSLNFPIFWCFYIKNKEKSYMQLGRNHKLSKMEKIARHQISSQS